MRIRDMVVLWCVVACGDGRPAPAPSTGTKDTAATVAVPTVDTGAKRSTAGTPMTRVEVTIQDTMAFWNNQLETHVITGDYRPTNTYVYLVPDAWVSAGTLTEAGIEHVCEYLYGKTWRLGNDDGSKYLVLDAKSRVLPEDDKREAKPIGQP